MRECIQLCCTKKVSFLFVFPSLAFFTFLDGEALMSNESCQGDFIWALKIVARYKVAEDGRGAAPLCRKPSEIGLSFSGASKYSVFLIH